MESINRAHCRGTMGLRRCHNNMQAELHENMNEQARDLIRKGSRKTMIPIRKSR